MNSISVVPEDALPASSGQTTVQSSQTSPTKSRTLQAVEIPSPSKQQASGMQAPAKTAQQGPTNAADNSFSSFSTLTSFSGISSQSSSRRVVKNGVQAVTNSDSASMSSSSSEDELADFESFAPRKKRKVTPPEVDANVPITSKPTRSSTRLDDAKIKYRARDSTRPLSPPPKTSYKYSLLNIAKQSAKEAASEKKIAEAEAYMLEAERLRADQEDKALEEGESKHIAATFAQDSDEEERMLMAIDRTEALRGEETFHFFRGEATDTMDRDFSLEELDTYGLHFLHDDTKRRQAFASGFLGVIASQKGLPGSLINWMQHQILTEDSDELCESYNAVLDALVKAENPLPHVVFSLSEIYEGQTFRDAEHSNTGRSDISLPKNLNHTLQMMSALAPQISPINQACALAELILLNNDDDVRSDIEIQIHIEQAMRAILDANDESGLQAAYKETIRQILHASSISRHLLSRAIASMPVTTVRLHELRRRLALQLLLDAPMDEHLDFTSPSTGVRLVVKLKKHPSFLISESTEYTALHSLTDLLDIAIDVGFADFSFLTRRAQSPKAQSTSLFSHNQAPQSQEESAFNAQIDAFVAQLRLMGSKIRDAGTSHLKRTEAKSALERLILRLECAVRTRPRPRKGVFDRGGIGNMMSAAAMEGFLKRDGDEKAIINGETAADANLGDHGQVKSGAQNGLGKQHKVTWKDDVIRDTKAGAEDDMA